MITQNDSPALSPPAKMKASQILAKSPLKSEIKPPPPNPPPPPPPPAVRHATRKLQAASDIPRMIVGDALYQSLSLTKASK